MHYWFAILFSVSEFSPSFSHYALTPHIPLSVFNTSKLTWRFQQVRDRGVQVNDKYSNYDRVQTSKETMELHAQSGIPR